jgi:hypothetical protein
MMEAMSPFEMSVLTRATRLDIQENDILHSLRVGNLAIHIPICAHYDRV